MLIQLPSCSLSVAGTLVRPVSAVRHLGLTVFIDNDLGVYSRSKKRFTLFVRASSHSPIRHRSPSVADLRAEPAPVALWATDRRCREYS